MIFAHIGMPDNIFTHHNRIIDQQTNTQGQRQQSHHIDAKAKGPDKG